MRTYVGAVRRHGGLIESGHISRSSDIGRAGDTAWTSDVGLLYWLRERGVQERRRGFVGEVVMCQVGASGKYFGVVLLYLQMPQIGLAQICLQYWPLLWQRPSLARAFDESTPPLTCWRSGPVALDQCWRNVQVEDATTQSRRRKDSQHVLSHAITLDTHARRWLVCTIARSRRPNRGEESRVGTSQGASRAQRICRKSDGSA